MLGAIGESSRHEGRPEAGVLAQSEYRGATARTRAARAAVIWMAAIAAQLVGVLAHAQRLPVLKQIDLPHSYYYREMYLPQVTSGPGSVAWSPNGLEVVYSMQGSLWRQAVDSGVAQQLTAGPGYDFQPDWSPDGTRIAFVRYDRDALELAVLDVATGKATPLTRNGAVNVEPRWSPDGKRLAWVSTAGTGHFHVFVGVVGGNGVTGKAPWTERRSSVPRYYYSAFDHELSPAWSPDGRELIYVGNPEIANGTGYLWRRGLDADSQPVLVRAEETSWKARPAWSPDGRRVVWSSYAGREWHQLWIVPAGGGDAFALSYGDFDATGARWSPDGRRLAFIANEAGTTEIRVQDAVGGQQTRLGITDRRHLKPVSRLVVRTVDAAGRRLPARVAIVASDGRSVAPDDALIRADDSFDRRSSAFETHYFHTNGAATVTAPAGAVTVTIWRGPENRIERRRVQVAAGATRELVVEIEPLRLPAGWREQWQSGDVHVHMNYGGTYRNTPERLVAQASAEDLDLVFNLIVNKEQRVPGIAAFSPLPDPASTPAVLLAHSQEYHTGYWGHVGLLGLRDHILLPAYAAFGNTAAASLYPTNAVIADLAHDQRALVGYVHPFEAEPDPAKDAQLTNALPVDAALGKVDYYEVVGFSDHRASAAVWYRLLNCGFPIAAAAGTDAMANFASLRGPVGLNRVYVLTGGLATDPNARERQWLAGLRDGHTMATNGPLLGLTVEGRPPGAVLPAPAGASELRYSGFLRSSVPVDHLELVWNGAVARAIPLAGDRRSADLAGTLPVSGPGWLLLRAWNDGADPDVFDLYPYATTNPVFLAGDPQAIHCGADADYFLAWIARLQAAAQADANYNTPMEREVTLEELRAARVVFEARR